MTTPSTPTSYPYVADLTQSSTQSSPDCFVRVLRFKRRDTREYDPKSKRPVTIVNEKKKGAANPSGIRHDMKGAEEETLSLAMDIGSDVVRCVVNKSKGSPTGTFSITLAAGDINYHHAVHPGDHVLIWMRRNKRPLVKVPVDEGRSSLIGKDVDTGYANNNMDSGLKMYGVITSVRRTFRTAADGKKLLMYNINGKDFGYFFEASVYYNQVASGDKALAPYFNQTAFGTFGSARSPDQIVMGLIDMYFGARYLEELKGLTLEDKKGRPARPLTENKVMFMPQGVRDVFGTTQREFVSILDRRVGVEQYITGTSRPDCEPLPGVKQVHVDVGAQYPVWAALKAYSNPTINEMFLDLKVRENGKLYPTFVCRQIPFTSTRGAWEFSFISLSTTRFVELPRVKIPESFIMAEDMGRGDHERFNYIELFGIYPGVEDLVTVPMQMYQGNFAVDVASIKRYGLRPLIAQSDFHFPDQAVADAIIKSQTPNKEPATWTLVPKWINLLTDWYLAAHTMESGTFQLVGIEEPITLGDNIEIVRKSGVNELYHIEAYAHSYSVDAGSGMKSFSTSVEVSRGQRVDEYPLYVSETINEDDLLGVGFSDQEARGMARPGNSSTEETTGISENEIPAVRKKESPL